MIRLLLLCLFGVCSSGMYPPKATAEKPNILFISLDDLNDWVGCLGGHPQAITPNLDRLAESGTLFTNAHCPAPACNPSRGAIMTGISPHVSGLYDNRQSMRGQMRDAELLPRYFSNHGYWSAGSGKILHYIIDAQSWDEYYPPKETEDPFPRTFYPNKRPVSLPRGGPWQYIETDWAALDVTDKEFGGDYLVSQWIGEQLSQTHDKPFFLACGIYRPHEPWFVPQEYFEPFPLEQIQLPPGYLEDDLDDLPPAAKQRGPNRYFAHIQEQGQWKKGIQGYLASVYFADTMLGRVLDALDSGPNKDNTIVVLWSDHGWHLGEKQHWQKYTGWRACTRIPLMIRVPKGTPGLPQGTTAGTTCDAPVNLLSLFPTLTQLSGLPAKETNDGPSLVPLLNAPNMKWPHASITYLGRPGNFGVSGQRFRYIRYDNGDEELYDIETDQYEWNNLAPKREFASKIEELKSFLPASFADYANNNSGASLPDLNWLPFNAAAEMGSNPHGDTFEIRISNKTGAPVKIFSIDGEGEKHPFGTLETGWSKPYETRPGIIWLVANSEGQPLGYFKVGNEPAHAEIPNPNP
ncbi:arylsulfatase A-like enzyme [Rhodopirellula rubra]|uniref:Arylsulfatase A-like enzyme n=2 Tax=Aporhodopirellula rubra TaxID=980271 RepID=A0A7W5DVC4_9BACT|nr:arylsulfatase A-like enzyme [Aporhodopirellula rubra]